MGPDLTQAVTHLVLQLAVILVAAKLAGEVCGRWLRIPAVLGELGVGVLIGPYALGAAPLPGFGPLFEAVGEGPVPVSPMLYGFAQVAAVVLLFVAGMETDLKLFIRYAVPGGVVATGGVLLPFVFGAGATVVMGYVTSWSAPEALFMGAIMTATSVGITARVLSDIRRLDTPEGVTVLAAAVLDDVLGILVLTVVVGISQSGSVSLGQVAVVGGKALGFWIALTGIGLLVALRVARIIGWFRGGGAGIALAVALALLGAALAEEFGLAMIIGAYSVGLAFSRTRLLEELGDQLHGLSNTLVPVFFVVMGMMVDVPAMMGAIGFGLVVSALAIISKVVGCGVPALAMGFNLRGAWRVGVGMLPRGEVALIVAGVGLERGVVPPELFGVAILMTIVTTVVGPLLLAPAFRGPSGRRGAAESAAEGAAPARPPAHRHNP